MGKGKDSSKSSTKRDEVEMARDRALVATLHVKGLNFTEIAAELNRRPGVTYTVSRDTVRRDYQKNIDFWNQEALTPTSADVRMQEERIRAVEIEAWAAWERSKDPAEQIKEVQELKDLFGEDGEVKDSVLVTKQIEKLIRGQVGDPSFLKIIGDCVDRRAKLHGQYSAQLKVDQKVEHKHEHTFKMYESVNPLMWDDPSIEVIDGTIYKDGKPVEIVDGQVLPLLESNNGTNNNNSN